MFRCGQMIHNFFVSLTGARDTWQYYSSHWHGLPVSSVHRYCRIFHEYRDVAHNNLRYYRHCGIHIVAGALRKANRVTERDIVGWDKKPGLTRPEIFPYLRYFELLPFSSHPGAWKSPPLQPWGPGATVPPEPFSVSPGSCGPVSGQARQSLRLQGAPLPHRPQRWR